MAKKRKTLKAKLTLLSALPVLATGFVLAVVFIAMTYSKYLGLYGDEGAALASAYASSVASTIDSLSQQVEAITQNPDVIDETLPIEERKAMLVDAAKTSEFKDFAIAYASGKTYNNTDISDREYFKQAMRTRGAYVSSPVLRKTDNSVTIMMGKYFSANGSSYVVYGGLAADTFSGLIQNVSFGEDGIAFILDRDGVVVGTSTGDIPQLASLVGADALEASMASAVEGILRDSSGITEFEHGGERYIAGYTTLNSPEEWRVVVAAPKAPVVRSVFLSALYAVLITLAAAAAAVMISMSIIGRIAESIAVTSRRISDMAKGDLSTPARIFHTNDEIETMSEATDELIHDISVCIRDIGTVLSAIA